MKIDISAFGDSLSLALDYAEREVLGIAPYHGSRVAAISACMAQAAGFSPDTVFSLTIASLLHDCALVEYLADELMIVDGRAVVSERSEADMRLHCSSGEKIVGAFPSYGLVTGAILYHHERADGKGAFGLTADQTPFSARLIHLADAVDFNWKTETMDREKYDAVRRWVDASAGTLTDRECADLFLSSVSYELMESITGDKAFDTVRRAASRREVELSAADLVGIAGVFAFIIDYKSKFTCRQSSGIAEKAKKMGEFYGLDEETCDKLYVAGALHDIGKLMVGNDILEKPGRLTDEEFSVIQNHAVGTHVMLDNVGGLEEIASWAANHHEKLDGSGYPLHKKAEELGRFERLMACIDIYQALVEDRPYKSGFPHEKAMEILRSEVSKGHLDAQITEDIDRCYQTEGF